MKKSKRWIYILAALLITVPLVGLIAVNLYIQSDPFRANLERTLARSLRLHLHIREITFAPWSGLRATADSLTHEGKKVENAPPTKLEADLELFPLLSRRVILHQVTLYDPRADWILGDDGEEEPEAGESAAADLPASPGTRHLAGLPWPGLHSAQVGGGAGSSVSEAAPAQADAAGGNGGNGNALVVLITSLNVERGELIIRQPDLTEGGRFTGISLRAMSTAPGEYDGVFSVDDAMVLGRVPLQNLKSPIRYRPGTVEFSNIESTANGGTLTGKLEFREDKGNNRTLFSTDLDFYDVQLSSFTPAEEEKLRFEKGLLEGGIRMQGDLENWAQSTGTAELIAKDAAFSRDSFISRLGDVLNIDELAALSVSRVWVSGKLEGGVFNVENGELRSDSVLLTAGGKVLPGARLRLDARLHLSTAISQRIPANFVQQFQPSPMEGFKYIDFLVRGTLDKPRTDLVDRLFPAKNEPWALLIRGLLPELTRLLPEDFDEPGETPPTAPVLEEGVATPAMPAPDLPALMQPNAPDTPAPGPAPENTLDPTSAPLPPAEPVPEPAAVEPPASP